MDKKVGNRLLGMRGEGRKWEGIADLFNYFSFGCMYRTPFFWREFVKSCSDRKGFKVSGSDLWLGVFQRVEGA